MMLSSVLQVKRLQPELITPAKPTPQETKFLSDIDDQESLRFQVPVIMCYKANPSLNKNRNPVKAIREALSRALVYYYPLAGRLREGPNRKLVVDCNGEGILFVEASADRDQNPKSLKYVPVIMCYKANPSLNKNRNPVKAIREALSRALVYYYPLAGRLREGPNRKLVVDCNGEGILFVEASANVTLEQLGDKILPPCPLLEEFLFNFPGSDGIIGCPLLLVQVTCLTCGGFILALRLNHTMCDASGLLLFLTAIAEMARGAHAPSILPVWERELLFARDPPRITCAHHEYEDVIGHSDGSYASSNQSNMVTCLTCGGFILALRLNHTMCDASGLLLFLTAIAEMARGAHAPSILPVWERELLFARDPPRITCAHHEYEDVIGHSDGSYASSNQSNMVQRSFYFGAKEMRVLRKQIPPHLISTCSTFDLITACLWKCRTLALKINPKEVVRVSCIVNARGKHNNLRLPLGYYGNAFAYPAAVSKAEPLCKKPLGYALELVKKAKSTMNEEYLRSVADLMVLRGRPQYSSTGSYLIVSDNTRAGFGDVNFGWGQPVFAGPAKALDLISFYVQHKKNTSEDGILVPMCLPSSAMERFQQELERITQEPKEDICNNLRSTRIMSMM
ncbi:hypothetical protein C1H46_028338 [Malus baccata]|uniref:Uncharacterized protein n=1 Tax=Malus baccata TaxID=106549 RepID=A0A540LI62_MALBA|nr:hypothetical protein C1H46_028338 [Malus baccata]